MTAQDADLDEEVVIPLYLTDVGGVGWTPLDPNEPVGITIEFAEMNPPNDEKEPPC